MNLYKYKYIIWDWNGTLLNDAAYCVSCMNILLNERKMPALSTEKYQDIFTFPVKDYYTALGFNFLKESFDEVGHAFMDLYFKDLHSCQLFSNVEPILKAMKDAGKQQFILSAMEQTALDLVLKEKQIFHYFTSVYGIDNHLAAGKYDKARQMIEAFDIDVNRTLLIGDTLHDKEVADALGCDSILVAKGHCSIKRLEETNSIVINDLNELMV